MACSARTCPDCKVTYANCAWQCYQDAGWDPLCVGLLSAKQTAMGARPSTYQLFASECDAQCWIAYQGDYYMQSSYEVEYKQDSPKACERAWQAAAAADYRRYETGFQFEGLLAPAPAWLSKELAKGGGADTGARDTCFVCRPSQQVGTAGGPAPPKPAKPASPSPAETTPASVPVAVPAVVPVVPAPTFYPSILAPDPEPAPAPAPAPGLDASPPPPAVPATVAGGPPPSSSRGAVRFAWALVCLAAGLAA